MLLLESGSKLPADVHHVKIWRYERFSHQVHDKAGASYSAHERSEVYQHSQQPNSIQKDEKQE